MSSPKAEKRRFPQDVDLKDGSDKKMVTAASPKNTKSSAPPTKVQRLNQPARVAPWQAGLLQAMEDKSLHLYSDDRIVIIRDKYPKAKYHLLVLPHIHLSNLNALNQTHTSLLAHMEEKARETVAKLMREDGQSEKLPVRYGYHGIPSMSQVHLHAISQDFDSPSFKNKKHWNSFTTDYFIESSDVIAALEEKGAVVVDRKRLGELLKEPLKCHRCRTTLSTIPKLKDHIKRCSVHKTV